jgi:hypothetical protein
MTTSRRSIGFALVFGLIVGALAGGGVVLARGNAAVTPQITLPAPTGPTSVGAPTAGSGVDSGPGALTGTAGSAIAYPYPGYPGSPGVAPDHTIVVTGVGQADLAADGSGRSDAIKKALAAALADAKAQADFTAQTVGVSITGVLSVSTTVQDYGPIYPPVPMEGTTAPGSPAPTTDGVALPQLSVAVTVAYSIS